MTAFLEEVYRDLREQASFRHIEEQVQAIGPGPGRTCYVTTTQKTHGPFDALTIATGAAIPKRLDSPRAPMATNAHEVRGIPLKRWQETIDPTDYHKYDGKDFVIVGLGNSAIEMLEQCMAMREAGIYVRPKVLTHMPRKAIQNPGQVVLHQGNELVGPMYRHPSDLSKIAGDIPRVEAVYKHALKQGWVLPGVTDWQVQKDERGTVSIDAQHTYRNGRETHSISDVAAIYALIGYQNNPETLRKLGVVCDDDGYVSFNPITRRVENTIGMNRMYVVGAVASLPDRRNEEVIPGMIQPSFRIAMSEILQDEARDDF